MGIIRVLFSLSGTPQWGLGGEGSNKYNQMTL